MMGLAFARAEPGMLELGEAEARPLVDSAGRSVAARPGAHSADVLGAAGHRRCWRLSAITPALNSLRATRLRRLLGQFASTRRIASHIDASVQEHHPSTQKTQHKL
jgi:hypothetical protein